EEKDKLTGGGEKEQRTRDFFSGEEEQRTRDFFSGEEEQRTSNEKRWKQSAFWMKTKNQR
ncbi:hypothetical protein Gohar_014392, partial [Gossypium harknessii]|nr:hypothetical protein [Gossypium harknessii]